MTCRPFYIVYITFLYIIICTVSARDMPFLLTEAALEAHQKELEQEPQPVLLYGASSPRLSPQHQEPSPPARGGFAGFFGSLVSSIGKRGVLGGSKLSAQPSTGCASTLLKAPDVSQFSSFRHGSRLDRFLTDAAKSAIASEPYSSGLSHLDSSLSKPQSKSERSSQAPQSQVVPSTTIVTTVPKQVHQSTNRRASLPNLNATPKISVAVSNALPTKASSSSGNSHINSASSLSSEGTIFTTRRVNQLRSSHFSCRCNTSQFPRLQSCISPCSFECKHSSAHPQ